MWQFKTNFQFIPFYLYSFHYLSMLIQTNFSFCTGQFFPFFVGKMYKKVGKTFTLSIFSLLCNFSLFCLIMYFCMFFVCLKSNLWLDRANYKFCIQWKSSHVFVMNFEIGAICMGQKIQFSMNGFETLMFQVRNTFWTLSEGRSAVLAGLNCSIG